MSGRDSPGVVVPPPSIFLATLAIGAAFDYLVTGWLTGFPTAPRYAAAGVLIAAGAALAAIALGLFWKAATRPEPWQPTSAIVTGGIYCFTRNPMYLGMALAYAGGALTLDSISALILLVPLMGVIDYAVIQREERYLGQKFGQEYLSYKRRVRRWF